MTTAATLLERLQASVAAARLAKGEVPAQEDAAALEATRRAAAAATAQLADLRAWIEQGSAIVGALWDGVPLCDSLALVAALGELSDRETGLMPALAMLQRHVETTLGERHGRGPIADPDGYVVAAVDRSAASVKWNVEDAWPDVTKAIRKADRLPIGDPVDGELEDDAAKVLRIIKALCGVSYLRVEVCKELGLDPDDYRTKSGYRWTVKTP